MKQTNETYCSKLNKPLSDFRIFLSSPIIAFDSNGCEREQVWFNGKSLRIPATSEAPLVSSPGEVASVPEFVVGSLLC